MNNYDMQYKTQLLADTHSKYELAKRILEMESRLVSIGELSDGGEPDPLWYVSLDMNYMEEFEDEKKVYILNDRTE